ncbi:hypothetical protein POVCU1_024210 [Plasmodium ovale curtisi]|uniref:Uncharacterized protein n=1 Tax=Plasmodium ovale curtisi TaxID=864141 RepID=A0A1A8WNJ2_PLAOA|nr:hypothetical protein POVCU1_024210 [Plasmodium ovale curtisi]
MRNKEGRRHEKGKRNVTANQLVLMSGVGPLTSKFVHCEGGKMSEQEKCQEGKADKMLEDEPSKTPGWEGGGGKQIDKIGSAVATYSYFFYFYTYSYFNTYSYL